MAYLALLSSLSLVDTAPTPLPIGGWPGWNNIDKLFVFGASYTTTGFDWLNYPQPSPSTPLGNTYRGTTLSNGPNFITYLTTTFNASMVETYNFAAAGASVDYIASSNNPYAEHEIKYPHNDMFKQVRNDFMTTYTPLLHSQKTPWSGASSLFISFFGINDCLSYYRNDGQIEATTDRIFVQYMARLAQLYDAGARNFLLLNTPPLALAPYFNTGETQSGHHDRLTETQRAADRRLIATTVSEFNSRFPSLVAGFKASHPDATLFYYDTHKLFTDLQTQPSLAEEYTSTYDVPDGMWTEMKGSCEFYTRPDSDYLGADDYRDE
ncbi:MAG: hypothetical protein Q9170_007256, partial [Blastenia crenularia]